MHKLKKLVNSVLADYQSSHAPLREKLVSSMTACFSILLLLLIVQYVELGLPFKMLVLASMGATAVCELHSGQRPADCRQMQ